MSVNASAHKVKVFLGSDLQDWSKQFYSFQGGWNERDRDGLFQVTGTLTLACNRFAPESMNPRRNRSRFARGQKLEITVTDSTGSYVTLPVGWLYIIKTPPPPTIVDPYLKIEVGCWLKLKDYSLPNGLVAQGRTAPVSRTAAIQNCLQRAASAYVYDPLKPPPSPLPSPPDWIGTGGAYSLPFNLSKVEGSFIQLAGQIAFGGLQNLYQDNQGRINSIGSAITPDTPTLSLKIGAPSGEEISYTPEAGSETPVRQLRYVATQLVAKPNANYSLSVSEDYGPASIVNPALGNSPIVIRRTTVEQIVSDDTRTKNTTVLAPGHLVSSVAFPKDTGLRLDSTTQEIETFEASADGKLLYSDLIEQRLYPAAMPEVFKRLSKADQAANKGITLYSKAAKTDYAYKQGVVATQATLTREPVGAVVTNEAGITNPAALIPSQYDSISYSQPRSQREWEKETVSNQALIRIKSDVKIDSTSVGDRVAAKAALTTKTNLIEISNAGQTNPPACERKPQQYSDEEKFIQGSATFDSFSDEPDDRLRTLELTTGAVSSAQLTALAQIEGAILWGRDLGQLIQVPLRDEILHNPVPLQQWLCTEPDGTKVLYQVNGIQFTLTADRAVVGAHGIWIGTVGKDTPYSPSVVDPVYAGLTVSEGDIVIPPPPNVTRSFFGGLVIGGRITLRPYPLMQTAAFAGGLVIGGRLSPSITAAFRGGLQVGGRILGSPVIDFRGGLVIGGRITLSNITSSFRGGLRIGGSFTSSNIDFMPYTAITTTDNCQLAKNNGYFIDLPSTTASVNLKLPLSSTLTPGDRIEFIAKIGKAKLQYNAGDAGFLYEDPAQASSVLVSEIPFDNNNIWFGFIWQGATIGWSPIVKRDWSYTPYFVPPSTLTYTVSQSSAFGSTPVATYTTLTDGNSTTGATADYSVPVYMTFPYAVTVTGIKIAGGNVNGQGNSNPEGLLIQYSTNGSTGWTTVATTSGTANDGTFKEFDFTGITAQYWRVANPGAYVWFSEIRFLP